MRRWCPLTWWLPPPLAPLAGQWQCSTQHHGRNGRLLFQQARNRFRHRNQSAAAAASASTTTGDGFHWKRKFLWQPQFVKVFRYFVLVLLAQALHPHQHRQHRRVVARAGFPRLFRFACLCIHHAPPCIASSTFRITGCHTVPHQILFFKIDQPVVVETVGGSNHAHHTRHRGTLLCFPNLFHQLHQRPKTTKPHA